jgi:iron complex outermembrane receptor protein
VFLYGWASYQDRESRTAGFFRRALDDRNVIQIYPDGFLPIIAPDVTDYSAAGGASWERSDWAFDASLAFGSNEMHFGVENSLNRSMGTASPTTFDAGGFTYDQLVFNFSAVRAYEVGGLASPLNVAAGLEAREETYTIFAGEPASYINGGVLLNGAPTASGAQVFPGFRPANVTDADRTAIGAYVDLEANLTEKFLGSAALRAEDYSDFGSNVSGKIAARFDFSDSFALRGSAQTGFRAPSLQQQYFATTSTNFIAGIPYDITSFPVSDPIARALGAQDLDAEEAVNYSFGAVLGFAAVTLTIDTYRIDIDDRIVLSENLTQDNVRAYLESQGFIGIGGGRFFINGVDTETSGIDVVLTWAFDTDRAGQFGTTVVANRNDTDVTRVPETAPLAALSPPPPLFARVNVLTFEEGNPDSKLAATLSWNRGIFGATVRATRYGEVLDPDPRLAGTAASPIGAQDAVIGAQTVIDLEGRFEPTERLRVAIGAENLLDEFPDAFPVARNATGNTPFSNYAPFGRSGRYVYGRVSFGF